MRYIFCILVCVVGFTSYGQKQNNNWCFGASGYINFNTSPPSTSVSLISAVEGCAVVSDRHTGDLLFYTEGTRIWTRQNLLMPNGDNIGTDYAHDCVQGSLIVPFPNDTNKYYVFTLENMNLSGALRYSVVDMTLNGGYGDVKSSEKAVFIDDNFIEALTSVNVCNTIWLITIKRGSNDFYLYRIDESGISKTPVISSKDYALGSNGVTAVKVSRNNQKLALTTFNGFNNISYLAMHDIDLRTGKISNGIIIDSTINRNEFYTCEFSPNSSRLYATLYTSRVVCQYDVSLPTAAAIYSSRQIIDSAHVQIGALQLGPDNNIYVSKYQSSAIDRITNCDLISPGCIYAKNALLLYSTTRAVNGLPQLVTPIEYSGPVISAAKRDTVVCNTQSVKLYAERGHTNYLWNNNDNSDSTIVTQSGTYWVKIVDSCFQHTDTIDLIIQPLQNVFLGNDTAICDGDYIEIKNLMTNLSGSSYTWSTSSIDSVIRTNIPGQYSLTVTLGNCSTSDTILLTNKPYPQVDIGNDTTICENTDIPLRCNLQQPWATYLWSNGSILNETMTNGKGEYSLTVDQYGCKTTDKITISHMPLPYIYLGEDSDLCYPQYLSLPSDLIKGTGYSFLWSTGSTDSTLNVHEPGVYKVQLKNICGIVSDSISVTYHSCSIWLPKAFSPNADGHNDLLRLVGDIKNVSRYSIMIYNRWGQRVYESNDVNAGWDGKVNGRDAENGTYYYLLRVLYNRKEEVWRGDVTLLH